MSDTWVDESVPPFVLRGPYSGGVDWAQIADLATLKADPTFGDGSGWSPPFGAQTYVVLQNGSYATWDGSTWSVYGGLTLLRGSPLPPIDEVDENDEPIDDDCDDETVAVAADDESSTDADS